MSSRFRTVADANHRRLMKNWTNDVHLGSVALALPVERHQEATTDCIDRWTVGINKVGASEANLGPAQHALALESKLQRQQFVDHHVSQYKCVLGLAARAVIITRTNKPFVTTTFSVIF